MIIYKFNRIYVTHIEMNLSFEICFPEDIYLTSYILELFSSWKGMDVTISYTTSNVLCLSRAVMAILGNQYNSI